MAREKLTDREWAEKADWEGGTSWHAFEYGLKPDDLDSETFPEFAALVNAAYEEWKKPTPAMDALDNAIYELTN